MTDYCTIEDIETQTSTPTLIQLTSDDGQEAVDRVVVSLPKRLSFILLRSSMGIFVADTLYP